MEKAGSSVSTASNDTRIAGTGIHDVTVPTQLKFLMSNIRSIINTQLTADTYPIWKAQMMKLFATNGFEGYIDGSLLKPDKFVSDTTGNLVLNPEYQLWMLVDQNLAAALYSTMSSALLPYVLSLDSCKDIWETIARRLQSSNRSRVLQIKNELHNITMKDKTMLQYLSEIKEKCDAIATAGTPLSIEDVILYTLNGLPATYQAFKTAIRTNLQPIGLDDFYALLCSEEVNQKADAARDNAAGTDPQFALYSRGRGRNRFAYRGRGRVNQRSPPSHIPNDRRGVKQLQSNSPIQCQICAKFGHSAVKCWYRMDPAFSSAPTALVAGNATHSDEWILDSGATSHMTHDESRMLTAHPYHGNNQVAVGNGDMLPIVQSGQGSDLSTNSSSWTSSSRPLQN